MLSDRLIYLHANAAGIAVKAMVAPISLKMRSTPSVGTWAWNRTYLSGATVRCPATDLLLPRD